MPSPKFKMISIFLVGGIAGIIFWGGFNTFMEYTNTLEFCISCHEMEQSVYQEYKKSKHYKNASGVSAICPDCHVPKPWGAKLWRKIRASNDLYHTLIGSIDTPAKFEAKRMQLAERVWRQMEETNSRECRNCHDYKSMDFHAQQRRAREKMEEAYKDDTPCIECHKGLVHSLPEEYEEDD